MKRFPFVKNNQSLIFFAGLAAAVVVTYLIGTNSAISAITSTWLWIMFVMVLFVLLASALCTDYWLFGWLINEQKRVSLSRLQMFLWTIVVLSAFVTAVFANLHFKHYGEAVAIAIPQELWLAMGISTTSLVGSALILETKKVKEPTEVKLKDLTDRAGVLDNRQDPPTLLDLIQGEEVANRDMVDLTRLQNLLFTFVLVGSYMASLGAMFTQLVTPAQGQDIATNFPITAFPSLGSSAIALLTISHAGYLAAKAIDNQPSKTNP